MKKIIIVSPHFPPSNLAAVHRSRLFCNHLPSFGWEPIIVCVHEDFHEEELDHNLEKLLPPGLRIEKVKAFKASKRFRLVGDIGLRGFFQMRRKILDLIRNEKIDFLYITIPSFYGALLGRIANNKTKVHYGIDYIDPWVHHFPGSERIFSRHWFSKQLAKFLEPIAIKKASLITGVAEGYYKDVLIRNPRLQCKTLAMPYGGEARDFDMVEQLQLAPYIFKKETGVLDIVYAGAMLPRAYEPLRAMFTSIRDGGTVFSGVRFHFIGTGKTPTDPNSYNIKPIAEEFGLWEKVIFEYPKRIPYLDVLIHLKAADAVFILGSTEPHYTPSKVYQAVLSKKPILALLHEESTGAAVIEESGVGKVLTFNAGNAASVIKEKFAFTFSAFMKWQEDFNAGSIEQQYFDQYSAASITRQLSNTLDTIVQ